MARHKSITLDRILELVEADDNAGICGACGAEAPTRLQVIESIYHAGVEGVDY